MITHPYEWLSVTSRRRGFWLLLAANMALIAALQVVGRPLVTAAAPQGIVSFEFAGRPDVAQAMVDSWGAEGRVYAGLSLGLDYLFMVAYASAIGLGCVLAAPVLGRRKAWLADLGAGLAWAQWAAAGLDAVENVALIQVLVGSGVELWPAVARWSALPKFAIVAVGLLYVVAGAGYWLLEAAAGGGPPPKGIDHGE